MHLVAVVRIVVALGQAHDHAQRAAARDDRRLVDRVRSRLVDRDDRVARLVIGGHLLLVLGHHHRPALGAHHDLVLGVLELAASRPGACCGRAASSAASLTRLARSAPEKPGVPRAMVRGLTSGASGTFFMWTAGSSRGPSMSGTRHHDLAVEAARAQQRRVEHVGPVGRGDDDDAFVGLEAVHLDQQLVQRLLALVVRVAEAVRRGGGRPRRSRR